MNAFKQLLKLSNNFSNLSRCTLTRRVDYPRYAQAHNISFNPLETHKITIADIEAIIAFQDLPPFQVGDIFFLYTGFIDALETLSEEDSVS